MKLTFSRSVARAKREPTKQMKKLLGPLVLCASSLAYGAPIDKESTVEHCATVAFKSRLVNSHEDFQLLLVVENSSSAVVELNDFEFWAHMLYLEAVTQDGTPLRKGPVPLISPGAMPIRIQPGDTMTKPISLNDFFPDLRELLRSSDIHISWQVQIRPLSGCFEELIKTSMTLKRLHD